MGILAKLAFAGIVGGFLVFLFVPPARQALTRLTTPSETVTVATSGADGGLGLASDEQDLEIVTLLGFDAIPAIHDPVFATAEEARDWMQPGEQVLGLSIDGDHRAYPITMLSRHEIVNDEVGGVPVAVTW